MHDRSSSFSIFEYRNDVCFLVLSSGPVWFCMVGLVCAVYGPVCYALVLYVLCLYVWSSGLLSTVLVYSSLGKSVTWFSVDDQTAPLTSEWTQNPKRTEDTKH